MGMNKMDNKSEKWRRDLGVSSGVLNTTRREMELGQKMQQDCGAALGAYSCARQWQVSARSKPKNNRAGSEILSE